DVRGTETGPIRNGGYPARDRRARGTGGAALKRPFRPRQVGRLCGLGLGLNLGAGRACGGTHGHLPRFWLAFTFTTTPRTTRGSGASFPGRVQPAQDSSGEHLHRRLLTDVRRLRHGEAVVAVRDLDEAGAGRELVRAAERVASALDDQGGQ